MDCQPEIAYIGKLQDKVLVAKVHDSAERMKHKKWQKDWQYSGTSLKGLSELRTQYKKPSY